MLKLFVENLREQSVSPPGEDKIVGACYQAIVELIKTDPDFKNFFSTILKERKIEPSHFSNLLYRGIQYIELYVENNEAYPDSEIYKTKENWRKRLLEIQKKHSGKLRKILLEKNTTTTIYQRYLGDKIVLSALFPGDKNLIVADFGCGGNYGLTGLSLGSPFKKFTDKTKLKRATKFSKESISLGDCLAVDKLDPSISAEWREACSFYPKELEGRKAIREMRDFENKIRKAKNVSFLKGDLLSLDVNHKKRTLPYKHFHAVLLNSILYQMSPQGRKKILSSARKCLLPQGVIIVQDFALVDKKNAKILDFDVNWFKKSGAYGTFVASAKAKWKFKQVLKWGNGRCTEVSEGSDFNLLLGP